MWSGLSLGVGGEKRDLVSSGLWAHLANFLAHFSPADLLFFFPTLSPRPDFLADLFLPCIMCIFVGHLNPSLEGSRYK